MVEVNNLSVHIIFMVHGPYFKAFRMNFGKQKVTKQVLHTGDTESLHNNGYEFCKIILTIQNNHLGTQTKKMFSK